MSFLPPAHFVTQAATAAVAVQKERMAHEHRAVNEQPQYDHGAFNAEAALARVDGNRELLRPMVGVFAMQWRKLADEIARAGRCRDGATLELTAHRLKESVASFGAADASRVAQELAARGRQGDFRDLEKTCASLEVEVERLVSGLKDFSKEMAPCAS